LLTFAACEELSVPANGERDCNGTTLGSQCKFTCNTGYTLEGAAFLTCGETTNGLSWNNSEPICNPGKRYYSHLV